MAAYTFQNGGCPADGTALACNDDTCGLQSSISWAVSGSETYSIQIGTFPGATNGGGGTFTVTCSNPQDVFFRATSPSARRADVPAGRG
jgi:hypothetical protein